VIDDKYQIVVYLIADDAALKCVRSCEPKPCATGNSSSQSSSDVTGQFHCMTLSFKVEISMLYGYASYKLSGMIQTPLHNDTLCFLNLQEHQEYSYHTGHKCGLPLVITISAFCGTYSTLISKPSLHTRLGKRKWDVR